MLEDKYAKELLEKAKELQKGLEYYTKRTNELEDELETLDKMYQSRVDAYIELEDKIRQIRDRLEIADDYFTNDVLDDLTKLLGEKVEE